MNAGLRAALGEVGRGLARYRAVGVCLAATFAIIMSFPAVSSPAGVNFEGGGRSTSTPVLADGTTEAAGTGTASRLGSGAAGASAGMPLSPEVAARLGNCDPATGRIRFPSVFAPPCVPTVSDNGGSTYRGVTRDEILVVAYSPQEDPALTAILRAMGVSDSREETLATIKDWIDMFQTHYETYGRRVRLEVFDASAPADDSVAARADAVQIATKIEPFAVLASAGAREFNDELARRGVVVLNLLQYPQYWWEERDPYMFGTQMSCDQVGMVFGEYLGKRLAGQKAVHAGSDDLRASTRNLGLLIIDDEEGFTRTCGDTLEQELARYGAALGDRVTYEFDLNRTQEQARVIIARLKDRGVTSVLFWGDPLSPIWFTQEATRQRYFPEWVIPGGNLLDTIYLGRVFDQRQWENAFGMSQLWIRPPQEQNEVYYQHVWHHGRPPRAAVLYEVYYQDQWLLFTAIHMAGPNLNPLTFRDGLFSYPRSGAEVVTQVQRSYGNQGVWPFTDYTGFDTVAEIWWDPDAEGPDEVGNWDRGMWRWVDGARRYGHGEWPSSPSRVFDPTGAPTHFDELPPSDRYPEYPSPR